MDGSKSILFSFRNLQFYILNFTFEKRSFDSHGYAVLAQDDRGSFAALGQDDRGGGIRRFAPQDDRREATRTPAYVTLSGAANGT